MCCVKVTPGPSITKAQADFIGCLMTAIFTAAPTFLSAFMNCMAGGNGNGESGKYNPGTRERCND